MSDAAPRLTAIGTTASASACNCWASPSGPACAVMMSAATSPPESAAATIRSLSAALRSAGVTKQRRQRRSSWTMFFGQAFLQQSRNQRRDGNFYPTLARFHKSLQGNECSSRRLFQPRFPFATHREAVHAGAVQERALRSGDVLRLALPGGDGGVL